VEIRAGERRDGTVELPGGALLVRCDGRPATALGRPAVVVDRTLDDATAAGIAIAMRLGTNYPLGLLAWGDRWGPATIVGILDAMQAWYGEDRYRPSALLRRIAAADGSLT